MPELPVRLSHHDHPSCPDYPYVNDTGQSCDACVGRWWRYWVERLFDAS